MLCDKYDYKTDIAVQREEAFEDGMQKKAVESAENFLKMGLPVEQVAKGVNLPTEQVKQIAEKILETATS